MTQIPMRARNSAETRAALIATARRLFASESYDGVALREIGEAARAHPSLIVHYFGGKDGLFAEALAIPEGLATLLAGGREGFGARVARALIFDEGRGVEGLMVAIRSVSSPKAPDLLRRSMESHFVEPLAEWLGGPERVVRARLILAYITGVALTLATTSDDASIEAKQGHATRFANGLQTLVGDGLAAAGA